MSETPNANELLDAACEHPTLDELMRRDPATMDDAERTRHVELLQLARARYIKAEAEKK